MQAVRVELVNVIQQGFEIAHAEVTGTGLAHAASAPAVRARLLRELRTPHRGTGREALTGALYGLHRRRRRITVAKHSNSAAAALRRCGMSLALPYRQRFRVAPSPALN